MTTVEQSPVIVACIVFYLAACLLIGFWAMRRTHSAADFFVAGKSLGLIVLAIASFSNIMSGFGFVGLPGLIYESGMSSAWMVLAAPIGFSVTLVILAKRMRLLAESREILTLPDAVAARYGGRWPRFLMAVAILLGVLGYLGTQVMAVGLVLGAVFGVDLAMGLLIGLSVLAFYSVAGGIIAGVYTDLFQGLLMIVSAALVFLFVLKAGGGMSEISTNLWRMDPDFIGPWGTRGPLTGLSWYLLFALGGAGQPHLITKFLMLREIRDLRWGGALTVSSFMILTPLCVGIGLVMHSLVFVGAQQPLSSPDQATPVFLLAYTPPLLAGVVFAGLLAAIMSTADSFINLGAAALVRDIPTAWIGRPLRHELAWSRVATLAVLLASAVFALYMKNLLALLGTFGWGTFAAAIVPAVAIGLNWKRATRAACVASILASIVLNFSLELLAKHDVFQLPYGLNVGCFTLLVSLGIFIGVSWMTTRKGAHPLPSDIEAAMEI